MQTARPGLPAMFVAAALAALALAACDKKEPPIDGIGSWHIGRSVVSDGTVCRPLEGGMTYCSHNPEMNIAEHRASVDLYFRGQKDSSPLSEILLALGACDVEAVDRWLTGKLGVAPAHRGRLPVWPGKAATVVAVLPASDGVCEIHFLEPGDEKRLAAIEHESQPAANK
ncbi:MAG TPA: hypothetical protein VKB80_31845 [Kofleriaceae bacterium]|nr:hypothetical protein [Kofleriaceae bacterium]